MKIFTKVIVRIMALYFICLGLFIAIGAGSALIIQYSNLKDSYSLIQMVITPLCYLGFGIALWFISGFISDRILGENGGETAVLISDINFNLIVRLIIIFIGAIFVINSLPKVISGSFTLIYLKDLAESTYFLREKSSVIEHFIKSIIGIILVVGHKGIGAAACKFITSDKEN
jgi:hypothetical protein